ncbi:TetR family transcriptional regulator [Mycobacterium mantenii]|uniref:TetR family transcriptional regulator n=1 Tax=Mycobacterium mantenii TaxID=560555 RepID=A0A1X0FX30_MYCNT|nr:TetR family transcriptional regulator [Mycobacterium mantenii]MCV7241661.1 TetR family transcriptional regulator [Mycobacterium mantenii]ORB06059.1 TetR family transcriptional regulator [Mycobacterium mantenii]BBY39961.1 TetR family transcriptional regulator [Mycobacterium mantenii]
MVRGERSPRGDHAHRVRTTLVDVALDLFSTQGYDATTTDEIAKAAGVSTRTFFRYFPTKQSILFFGAYDFIQGFRGVYLAQPTSVSDLDAMTESFASLAIGLKRIRRRVSLYQKAVATSLVLRGQERHDQDGNAQIVALAVAERRGLPTPDAAAEVLAGVGLLLLDRAVKRWVSGHDHAVDDLVRHEFAALSAALR